ncbi:hypothetical protein Btru_001609 [Bulinus truncatus]|nr:hypothetical protein Btru_001609 [Bulinus truncatus]
MDQRSVTESSSETNEISSVKENNQDQLVSKILRPYNALRNLYGPRTALIIASEQSLRVPDDLKTFTDGENGVNVHYTKKLPLVNSRHPPIDVIVFIYKVFDQDSFKTIKDSLPYIDIQYLVGKCIILVTHENEFCRSDLTEIETFAGTYGLPIYFATKQMDSSGRKRLQIPTNLMALYCPRNGRDVNSLLANATLVRSSRWCTNSEN